MFQLIESQLLFLFLKYKFFSLEFSFKLFSLPFKSSYFLVSLLLDLSSLSLKLLNLLLKLIDSRWVDLFMIGWAFLFLFLHFCLDLLHFWLFYNVGFMKFSDLFFFLVYGLYLLFSFLCQLFQLFLHPLYFLHGLFVLVVFDGFFLGLSYFW